MKNHYPKGAFKYFLLIFGLLLPFSVFAAGESGVLKENVRLRNSPGTTGTKILAVFPKGTQVDIQQKKNDWFEVITPDGKKGWMTTEFVEGVNVPEKPEEKNKATTTTEKMYGQYIENTRLRKTPSTQEKNIISVLPQGTTVEIQDEEGEWYKVQLKNGTQGWSSKEFLKKVDTSEYEKKEAEKLAWEPGVVTTSTFQLGSIPAGVDLKELNEYWLQKINALRAKKDLRQLALDQRWVDTATEWAGYMGKKGVTTHTRPDGKSMHKWIDTKGLDFTKRYSADGWQVNYFTENIAWGIAPATTEGVKKVLDNTLAFFLKEASYNGDHYRTIYHKDWNSVGLGFYFEQLEGGKQKVYVAMHYGSLQMP